MFEDYKDKFAGPGNRDARDQEIKRLKQHSQAFIDAESSQKAS